MQLKVITSFVTGETVFAILHTGIYGKVFAVPVYLITSPTSGAQKIDTYLVHLSLGLVVSYSWL